MRKVSYKPSNGARYLLAAMLRFAWEIPAARLTRRVFYCYLAREILATLQPFSTRWLHENRRGLKQMILLGRPAPRRD
jgi:hypothetical protein